MHFRKPSEPKHQDDNKSIKSDMASRRSVSLGSPAPTQFSHSRPATQITLPDSLGGISEGITWDIPHLGDLDLSGPLLSEKHEPVMQTRSPSPPRQPSQPPSRPATQQGGGGGGAQEQQTQAHDATQSEATTSDGAPLSSAIDIILARSRVYAPNPRNEQPWWTTRTSESAAAAERARAKLQDDHSAPPGTELYLIYPVDGCDARQTRSVDKHLEGSVEAYAMQRSNLFEGVLFWRALLTTSQMELIRAMPEVSLLRKPELSSSISHSALSTFFLGCKR